MWKWENVRHGSVSSDEQVRSMTSFQSAWHKHYMPFTGASVVNHSSPQNLEAIMSTWFLQSVVCDCFSCSSRENLTIEMVWQVSKSRWHEDALKPWNRWIQVKTCKQEAVHQQRWIHWKHGLRGHHVWKGHVINITKEDFKKQCRTSMLGHAYNEHTYKLWNVLYSPLSLLISAVSNSCVMLTRCKGLTYVQVHGLNVQDRSWPF